jgi:prepilin-type N-terminal cleavage/methylation domain-containing protein
MSGGEPMRGDRSASACDRLRYIGQKGFSLLEILIAMTVTLIGLAGLLSLHLTTVRGNSRATRTVMASVIGQQTMDELRSLPVQAPTGGYVEPTLTSRFGIPSTDVPMAVIQGPDHTSYRRLVSVSALGPVGSPLENVLLVRIEIAWTDEGASAAATDSRLHHRMVLESIRTLQDVL